MKAFATLYSRLDATTSSNAKLAAMRDYFRDADPADAAWAVYLPAAAASSGPDPRPARNRHAGGGPAEWLFEESYRAVGDMAETISLLMPRPNTAPRTGWPCDAGPTATAARPAAGGAGRTLPALWVQLDRLSLMVCIKLITGAFRVGVSKLLVTRALASLADLDPSVSRSARSLHRPVPPTQRRGLSRADRRRIRA